MGRFRVMTANVAGQEWMGWRYRKKVAARVFRDCHVHLVGFQEFGLRTQEDLEPGQPNFNFVLGEKAGDIYINTAAYDHKRYELLANGTVWLTDDGSHKPCWGGQARGASWLHLTDKDAEAGLMLVNVHLDNKSPEARIEGLRLALDFIRTNAPTPAVVVTADSNVSVASPDPRWQEPDMKRPYEMMLEAGFRDCWTETHPRGEKRPCTYHAMAGEDYGLDEFGTWDTEWVFARGLNVFRCLVVRDSYGGTYPSDHYWMIAELDF